MYLVDKEFCCILKNQYPAIPYWGKKILADILMEPSFVSSDNIFLFRNSCKQPAGHWLNMCLVDMEFKLAILQGHNAQL